MKTLPKLIRRFVCMMLISCILLILLNLILFAACMSSQIPNRSPWQTAEDVASSLQQEDNGYALPEAMEKELQRDDAWAIFIDDTSRQVVWQTENLPDTVPMTYSISDISRLTRGYIDGYPTFTGEAENGLAVLGYPKDRFWKDMWPSWDYHLIANLPKTILLALAVNAALVCAIYLIANAKLLKSINPIVNGIQALPQNKECHLKEKGLLSELAASINKTSEILQSQSRQLRKKETARANWIAGVSHDIRTPLSMIMGYAAQIKSEWDLPEDTRKKAAVIVTQSGRMRNLINDLNLASKLEYNMQPINCKEENLVALVRQVVVDFINMEIDDQHPIEWKTDEALSACFVTADKDLISRAIGNLIQNSINHNEQGCHIFVQIMVENDHATISVADDGIGATDEEIKRLNHAPHYMVCDENTSEQHHGLGLLLVKQIAAAHEGEVTIGHSPSGGFEVKISLPSKASKRI